MPFLSVTRLRIRGVWYLPAFLWYTFRSYRQAKRAPGCLRVTTYADANRAFWTLTAWTDEASMKNFMLSGAHRKAMPKLLEWCDEAFVAHWNQDSVDLPSWTEAHRQMLERGRPSKVNHPSPAHLKREIPPPRVRA
jgi:hypothetical protein